MPKKVSCEKCKRKTHVLYSNIVNKNLKVCMECYEKCTPCYDCGVIKKYFSTTGTTSCRVCKYNCGFTWYFCCRDCYCKTYYTGCKVDKGPAAATYKVCFKCCQRAHAFQCYDCLKVHNKLNLSALCADVINQNIATRRDLKELNIPEKVRRFILFRRDCRTFSGN